jgi:hypothetical protein
MQKVTFDNLLSGVSPSVLSNSGVGSQGETHLEIHKEGYPAPCLRLRCFHDKAGHCGYRLYKRTGGRLPIDKARAKCPMIFEG